MDSTANTPKTMKRSEWITQRAAELLASGWQSQALATKRAGKEWAAQSPQRAAANRRNAALEAARLQHIAEQVTA
jgi:hypothetical protein